MINGYMPVCMHLLKYVAYSKMLFHDENKYNLESKILTA